MRWGRDPSARLLQSLAVHIIRMFSANDSLIFPFPKACIWRKIMGPGFLLWDGIRHFQLPSSWSRLSGATEWLSAPPLVLHPYASRLALNRFWYVCHQPRLVVSPCEAPWIDGQWLHRTDPVLGRRAEGWSLLSQGSVFLADDFGLSHAPLCKTCAASRFLRPAYKEMTAECKIFFWPLLKIICLLQTKTASSCSSKNIWAGCAGEMGTPVHNAS